MRLQLSYSTATSETYNFDADEPGRGKQYEWTGSLGRRSSKASLSNPSSPDSEQPCQDTQQVLLS